MDGYSSPLGEDEQRIMERLRRRREDLGNKNSTLRNESSVSSSKDYSTTSDSSKPPFSPVNESECQSTKENSSSLKGEFAALASQWKEFQDEDDSMTPNTRPKESYLRGSPRRSSHAALKAARSPAKTSNNSPLQEISGRQNDSPEARRIRFADPIASHTTMSTVCDEYSTVTSSIINETSILACHGDVDSVASFINGPETIEMSSDEYGAHTFLKKKTTKSESSSSLKICSPKPFVRGNSSTQHTPVSFTPMTTSSPRVVTTSTVCTMQQDHNDLNDAGLNPVHARKDFVDDLEMQATASVAVGSNERTVTQRWKVNDSPKESGGSDEAAMSPVRLAAIQKASAKTMAQKLESQLRESSAKVSFPQKQAATPVTVAPAPIKDPVTPTMPDGVQTQWRGSYNTPVVVGRDASEPTRVDVKASGLKQLKNRWEFCSLTGTPIHPDEPDDDLVAAAKRMQKTMIPCRVGRSAISSEKKEPVSSPLTPSSDRKRNVNSTRSPSRPSPTKSPKSPRFVDESENDSASDYVTAENTQINAVRSPCVTPRTSLHKHGMETKTGEATMDPPVMEVPEHALNEDTFADNEESFEDDVINENVSKFIDREFGFIGATSPFSMGSPQKAPLATSETDNIEQSIEQAVDNIEQTKELYPKLEEETPILEQKVFAETPSSVCTTSNVASESTNKTGGSLPYSVSFYRRRMKEHLQGDPVDEVINLNGSEPSAPLQTFIGRQEQSREEVESAEIRLREMMLVQQRTMQQASKAIEECRKLNGFIGGHEEITAQRILMVAREKCNTYADCISRSGYYGRSEGPYGMLSITQIAISLDQSYLQSAMLHQSDDVYHFFVMVKAGDTVLATSSSKTSDDAIKTKRLEFTECLTVRELPPDFVCHLEVYGLRTARSNMIPHSEKYKLTAKSKTLSKHKTMQSGNASSASSTFQLVGRTKIDIRTQGSKHHLYDVVHPLDGNIKILYKKAAMERSNAGYRGFLSLYQRTKDGFGTWSRFWCVLESGEVRFWRSPEDEANQKAWMVLLDLQTCASEGATIIRETCPYPNSFYIDVWVPKDGLKENDRKRSEVEKLRVMLAADTPQELKVWTNIINQVTKHVLLWKPIAYTK